MLQDTPCHPRAIYGLRSYIPHQQNYNKHLYYRISDSISNYIYALNYYAVKIRLKHMIYMSSTAHIIPNLVIVRSDQGLGSEMATIIDSQPLPPSHPFKMHGFKW